MCMCACVCGQKIDVWGHGMLAQFFFFTKGNHLENSLYTLVFNCVAISRLSTANHNNK